MIVRHRAVQESPLVVVGVLLVQCLSQALDDSALDLSLDQFRVDRVPDVLTDCDVDDVDIARSGIDVDDRGQRTERVAVSDVAASGVRVDELDLLIRDAAGETVDSSGEYEPGTHLIRYLDQVIVSEETLQRTAEGPQAEPTQ